MGGPYQEGTLIQITGTFTNKDGAAADPSTILVKVKDPIGAETTYTYGVDVNVTKASTGVYNATLTPAIAGLWWYRWEGTGALIAQDEASFTVKLPNVT